VSAELSIDDLDDLLADLRGWKGATARRDAPLAARVASRGAKSGVRRRREVRRPLAQTLAS
jgi:hypothetical protein